MTRRVVYLAGKAFVGTRRAARCYPKRDLPDREGVWHRVEAGWQEPEDEWKLPGRRLSAGGAELSAGGGRWLPVGAGLFQDGGRVAAVAGCRERGGAGIVAADE